MKLHETEQAYLCPYWGTDFVSWSPGQQKDKERNLIKGFLNHEKSLIWISCLIECQNQESINLQKMWVLSCGLLKWHHSLTLSQGPVSAGDLLSAIFGPAFSQSKCTVRNSVSSFPDQTVETDKDKVHKRTEEKPASSCSPWLLSSTVLLMNNLGFCRKPCAASALLLFCVFLLWNIYFCERWKTSGIGMPWTAQCLWGTYSSVKDLAWFLELCEHTLRGI